MFWLQGSLLKQLAIANKSIGGGVVVVLAERDKEEMEMDIAKLEFDLMGTSVICRSGSPLILADLKKVLFNQICGCSLQHPPTPPQGKESPLRPLFLRCIYVILDCSPFYFLFSPIPRFQFQRHVLSLY